MAIKYFVFSTNLRNKKMNVGKVTDLTDYSQKDLVERMAQSKTGLGKADIEAIINILKDTIFAICKEGGSIHLNGLMSIHPCIGGTFEFETSGFDRNKNSVYVIAKISSQFNEQFQAVAEVERVQASERRPMISEVIDLDTGDVNKSLTRNNIITIKGDNLKFDPKSEDEYLDIINASNEAESITITKFQKISDKEIVFLCPALSFTNVYIEIGSLMGTRSLRVGESEELEVRG